MSHASPPYPTHSTTIGPCVVDATADATADAAAVLGVPEDDGFYKVGDVEM